MALPLSEISAAAKIAYTIYDLGFSKYTSAQQEYLDFGKDISLLRDGLNAIVHSVEHVNKQGPHVPVENPHDLASFYTIVGDFKETLNRCEKLIRKNSQFSRDSNGFVRNVLWNSGLGKYVEYLGRRVSFHCSKINLILVPLKLKMYTDIRRDIATVHEDIIFQLEQIIRTLDIDSNGYLLDVPIILEEKFRLSVTRSGSAIPFPIEKGVDALALHLGNSTQKFVLQPPLLVRPDACQYINLMKSVWLVRQLQKDPEFEARCLDVLWGAYFRQLLRKVIHECRRFYVRESPLIAPDDQQILQEADDKFEIWVHFDEVDDFDDLTEPNGLEIRIFRASLPEDSGRAQQISVLRVNTSRIRLVRTLTRGSDRAIENYEIDSQRVLLLPFYSFPEASADAISLGWKAQASDHQSRALTFRRLKDLHRLQEAITNFGIVADQTGLTSVQIKESTLGSLKSIGSGGRAQIWVCRAQKRYEQPAAASLETDSSSPRVRQSSTLTGSSGWNGGGPGGWARSYATSVNGSTSIQQSGSKALIERPICAQLVLFTESKKGLKCFVAIQIDDGTKLSPENCHCNNPDKNCKKIVIKSSHKTGVHVKIYETKPRHEDQWNLAVFGYPEHEDARKDVVTLHKSKFTVVEFENEQAREEIMNVFEETCCLMRERVRIYHQDLTDSRNRNVAQ